MLHMFILGLTLDFLVSFFVHLGPASPKSTPQPGDVLRWLPRGGPKEIGGILSAAHLGSKLGGVQLGVDVLWEFQR